MSAALACGLSSAAKADAAPAAAAALPEVLMNSQSVTLPSANCLLIRTAMTPSEVNLSIPVDMQNTRCAEYGQVLKGPMQNGLQCGYDRLVRRVCRDLPRQCSIDPRTKREHCAPLRRECHNEFIDQARVCTWLETECVRTEIVPSTQLRSAKLKFKKVASLAAGETETYELKAKQNHLDGGDAKMSLSPVATKRAVKITAKDGLFTGFKDVITIKGD